MTRIIGRMPVGNDWYNGWHYKPNGGYWRPVALMRGYRNLSKKEVLASPEAVEALLERFMAKNSSVTPALMTEFIRELINAPEQESEVVLLADVPKVPFSIDDIKLEFTVVSGPEEDPLPPPPIETPDVPPKADRFKKRLEEVVNSLSMESGSDTPDFILAEFLSDCLAAFDKAVTRRSQWYGVSPAEAPSPEPQTP